MPLFSVRGELAEYCRAEGLKLWVFSVADARQYARYARDPAIDVVFCDAAGAVAGELA